MLEDVAGGLVVRIFNRLIELGDVGRQNVMSNTPRNGPSKTGKPSGSKRGNNPPKQ